MNFSLVFRCTVFDQVLLSSEISPGSIIVPVNPFRQWTRCMYPSHEQILLVRHVGGIEILRLFQKYPLRIDNTKLSD